MRVLGWLVVVLCVLLTACEEIEQAAEEDTEKPTLPSSGGETGKVVDIIDGDTIDVRISGEVYRVRYIGVNTPERDDDCYAEATNANADLVEGQTVTLERDVSDTDQYGRLLRYVYVGDTFVNAALV
ncbi:MAG TPA: thermonuclease family protein, partial [Aggregatilineaceae bacterium]|nr:thermonuclease family protein [Aggregatilineaceae bacterium]